MTSRDAADLYAPLRERWEYLRDLWRASYPNGPEVELSATYRDKEDQNAAHQRGASTLRWKQSLHNYEPAYAFDFFFEQDGRAIWDRADWYAEFGEMAKNVGLEWGGDWTRLVDRAHVQMPMTWYAALDGRIPELPPLPAKRTDEWQLVVHLRSNVMQVVPIPPGTHVVTRMDADKRRIWVDVREGDQA